MTATQPERVWIQHTDEHDEWTWCVDQIEEDDWEYVNAAALRERDERIAELEAALDLSLDVLERVSQVMAYAALGGDIREAPEYVQEKARKACVAAQECIDAHRRSKETRNADDRRK